MLFVYCSFRFNREDKSNAHVSVSTYLEVDQKCSAQQRHIFNSLVDVSRYDEILSIVFDISLIAHSDQCYLVITFLDELCFGQFSAGVFLSLVVFTSTRARVSSREVIFTRKLAPSTNPEKKRETVRSLLTAVSNCLTFTL